MLQGVAGTPRFSPSGLRRRRWAICNGACPRPIWSQSANIPRASSEIGLGAGAGCRSAMRTTSSKAPNQERPVAITSCLSATCEAPFRPTRRRVSLRPAASTLTARALASAGTPRSRSSAAATSGPTVRSGQSGLQISSRMKLYAWTRTVPRNTTHHLVSSWPMASTAPTMGEGRWP